LSGAGLVIDAIFGAGLARPVEGKPREVIGALDPSVPVVAVDVADPDRVDLSRNGVAHLTFGFGQHICLGFPLARLEGQVVLPAVLARWREIEVASQPIEWLDSLVLRGMKTLPLHVRF